jgi:hypothetical protein
METRGGYGGQIKGPLIGTAVRDTTATETSQLMPTTYLGLKGVKEGDSNL